MIVENFKFDFDVSNDKKYNNNFKNKCNEKYNNIFNDKIFQILKIKRKDQISHIFDNSIMKIEEKLFNTHFELKEIWSLLKLDNLEINNTTNSNNSNNLNENTNSKLTSTSADNYNYIEINPQLKNHHLENKNNSELDQVSLKIIADLEFNRNSNKEVDPFDFFFSYEPPVFKNEELILPKQFTSSEVNNIKIESEYKNNFICRNKSNRTKYKMFDSNFKEICLNLIEKGRSIEEVSNEMNVPKKSLKRWIKFGAERKRGCGRKIKDPEMELKLIEWYNSRKNLGKNVYPKLMKTKALELTKLDKKDFFASKGWLEKLKRKYNLEFNRRKKVITAENKNNDNK